MRIAQIAPLTEAIPPKLYGGTERVVSWLTEELVSLGHEVTLFASGDSVTTAKLRADLAAGAPARRAGARSDGAAHVDAGAWSAARRPVRRAALPSRLLSVLDIFAPGDALHHHPARPARPARASGRVRRLRFSTCDLDLRQPARARAAGALGAHHPSRPADQPVVAPARSSRNIWQSSDASRPKRRSTRRSASPSAAACRSRSPPRSIPRTASISSTTSVRCSSLPGVDYIGEISDSEKSDFLSGAHRAADADQLARAVRPGDDRGNGLRHAGAGL